MWTWPPLELSTPRGRYSIGKSGGCVSLVPGRPKNGSDRPSGDSAVKRFNTGPSGRTAAIMDAGIQSPSLLGAVTNPSGVRPIPSELRNPDAKMSAR